MDNKIPSIDAPACFAAASVFSHESATCNRCPAFANCSEAAFETLQRIKDTVNVSDLLRRHKQARAATGGLPEPTEQVSEPRSSTPDEQVAQPVVAAPPMARQTKVTYTAIPFTCYEQELVDRANKNAQRLAKTLWAVGLTAALVRTELLKGVNPCDSSAPQYFSVLCDLLIHGSVTQRMLREELEKRGGKNGGGQSSSTAVSCASVLFAFVKLFGIAQEEAGALVLTPTTD